MRMPAAVLLRVLGDVEQVRKIAERAHHLQGLLDVERVQQCVQFRPGRRGAFGIGLGAPERHRGLADALDFLEHVRARVLADHLAEQPPEQPPVLAQQLLLGVLRGVGNTACPYF